ncbi:hypothetical protein ACNF49_20025 [Actinomadura sp. ATCC 39365]
MRSSRALSAGSRSPSRPASGGRRSAKTTVMPALSAGAHVSASPEGTAMTRSTLCSSSMPISSASCSGSPPVEPSTTGSPADRAQASTPSQSCP